MIRRILSSTTNTITFSAGLIASSVGISALLGLLRDRVLIQNAEKYLEGIASVDVYFAAFRIPDLIYGILITGGIVAAFLPVFSHTREKNSEEGWRLVNNTFNILLLLLLFLCGVIFLFAPFVVRNVIAPGLSPGDIEQTVILTRIMLLSPIILGISGLFSGVLQYFNKFLAYSLAPVFYNLGIILGIIFLVPLFGITGLAYGVILGALLHLFIQVPPACLSGFSYKPVLDLRQKELHKIFYLLLPRLIGQASSKINMIVITALASMLVAGSISIFNLAYHLQTFPIRVIGVSFAVAAFPAFSKSLAAKEKNKFFENFSAVVCQVLFLIIPASAIIYLLRAHIVRLVLGVEGFGWRETQLTAASLGVFAFSFFAAALVHVLVRAFFSFQNTKTPVIASVVSMGTNIALSFFFIWALGFDNFFRNLVTGVLRLEGIASIEVIAFPLALFISNILHFLLLVYFLKNKINIFRGTGIKNCVQRALASTFVAGASLFLALRVFGGIWGEIDTFLALFAQTAIACVVALLVYIFVSKAMNSPELSGILQSFSKK